MYHAVLVSCDLNTECISFISSGKQIDGLLADTSIGAHFIVFGMIVFSWMNIYGYNGTLGSGTEHCFFLDEYLWLQWNISVWD
jgi:hypothetical protein